MSQKLMMEADSTVDLGDHPGVGRSGAPKYLDAAKIEAPISSPSGRYSIHHWRGWWHSRQLAVVETIVPPRLLS